MFEGVRKWFSNLLGGNKQSAPSSNRDEEEERRRRQAAQQKQQKQQQTPATLKLKTVQEQWADQTQKQEAPLKKVDPNYNPVQQQAPQKIKTFQENVAAQQGGDPALNALKNKLDQNTYMGKNLSGLSRQDQDTAKKLIDGGKNADTYIKGARETQQWRKKANLEKSLPGQITGFSSAIWDMLGDPLVKTGQVVGGMGETAFHQVTGNQEAAREAKAKTKEYYHKSYPGQFGDALIGAGNTIGATIAGHQLLKDGIDADIVMQAMDEKTAPYGVSTQNTTGQNALGIGSNLVGVAAPALGPVVAGPSASFTLSSLKSARSGLRGFNDFVKSGNSIIDDAVRQVGELDTVAPQIIKNAEVNGGKVADGISSPNRGQQAAQIAAEQLENQRLAVIRQAQEADAQAALAAQRADEAAMADEAAILEAAETPDAPTLSDMIQPQPVDAPLNQAIDEVRLRKQPITGQQQVIEEVAPMKSPLTRQTEEIAAQAPPVPQQVIKGTNKTQAELDGMVRALVEDGIPVDEARQMALKIARRQAGETAPKPDTVKSRGINDMDDAEVVQRFGQDGESAADIRTRMGANKVETKASKPKEVTSAKDSPTSSKSVLKGGDDVPTIKEIQDAIKDTPRRADRKMLNRLRHAVEGGDARHIANVMADYKGVPKAEKPAAIANPARTAERQNTRIDKAIDQTKADMKAASGKDLKTLQERKTLLNRIKYKLGVKDRTDLDKLKADNPEVFEELGVKYRKASGKTRDAEAPESTAAVNEYRARWGENAEGMRHGNTYDADGSYNTRTNIMEIDPGNSASVQRATVNHESVHKAINEALDDAEVNTLFKAIDDRLGDTNANRALNDRYDLDYSDKSSRVQTEEYLSELFTGYAAHRNAGTAKSSQSMIDADKALVKSTSAQKWLEGRGFSSEAAKTIAGIFEKVLTGINKAREATHNVFGSRASKADHAAIDKFFDDLYTGKMGDRLPAKTVAGKGDVRLRKKQNPVKAEKFKNAAGESLKKMGHTKTKADMKADKAKLQSKSIATLTEDATNQVAGMKKKQVETTVSDYHSKVLSGKETTPEDDYLALAAAKKLSPSRTTASGKKQAKIDEKLALVYESVGDKLSETGQKLALSRGYYSLMPAEWHVGKQLERLADSYKKAGRDYKLPTKGDRTKLIKSYEKMQKSADDMDRLGAAMDKALASKKVPTDKQINKIISDYEKSAQRVFNAHTEYEITLNGMRLKPTKLDKWNDAVDRMPGAVDSYVRYAMLSGIEGRGRDLISTSVAATEDAAANIVSTTIGKAWNATAGRATGRLVKSDYGINSSTMGKSAKDIGRDVKSQFLGQSDSASVLKHSKIKAGTELGDADRKSLYQQRTKSNGKLKKGITTDKKGKIVWGETLDPVNPVKGAVRVAVGSPTSLTVGAKNKELYQLGILRAKEMGIPKADQSRYARLFMHAKSQGREVTIKGSDEYNAVQKWFRINSMHDNAVSRVLKSTSDFVYKFGDNIENRYGRAGMKLASGIVNRTLIPFTQWMGGATHNIFTRYNPLYHAGAVPYKTARNLIKGTHNPQEIIDHIGHLTTTSAGWAGMYALAESGVIGISDTNDRGDDYNGPYIKFGSHYISAPQLGPVVTSGVLALYAMNKAKEEGVPASHVAKVGITTTMKAATAFGVADAFQPELIKSISDMGSSDEGTAEYGTWKTVGDVGSTFIPAFSRSVAKLANTSGLEPDTKVQDYNPETGRMKTNQKETTINRLKSSIPGLANELPRKQGEMASGADTPQAPNLIERIWGATKENSAQKELNEKYGDNKPGKMYKPVGKPDMELAKKQKSEGKWDDYIKTMSHAHDVRKTNEDPKDTQERQRKIVRAEVSKSLKLAGEDLYQYEKVTLTDWRNMGDPDSEEYDPAMYQKLWNIDVAMTEREASMKTGGYEPWKTQKYSTKKKSSGSGGGGGGGGKSPDFTFTSQYKASDGGNFEAPKKATVAGLPNVVQGNKISTDFKKTVSVKKGRHL